MAMNHDPLCPPGLKAVGPDECPWCVLLMQARADERALMSGAKPSGMSDLTVTDSPHDVDRCCVCQAAL